MSWVRDHIPLQQGLRLVRRNQLKSFQLCQRPYSTTTRIKTARLSARPRLLSQVRDHIPLQQGLRPLRVWFINAVSFVRDHIPLQQGLRSVTFWHKFTIVNVRDHIPLQQGLRLYSGTHDVILSRRQRPYSITTRIKTKHPNLINHLLMSVPYSTTTRIGGCVKS